MRCFIALELDALAYFFDKIKAEIGQKGVSLATGAHITLKFLGDVKSLSFLNKALSSIVVPSLVLKTESIGFFPNENHPKTIWLGLEKNERLSRFKQDIDSALFPFGFHKDLDFVPHVTLGRLKKSVSRVSFVAKAKSINLKKATFRTSSFSLMKSVLGKKKPEYVCLRRF